MKTEKRIIQITQKVTVRQDREKRKNRIKNIDWLRFAKPKAYEAKQKKTKKCQRARKMHALKNPHDTIYCGLKNKEQKRERAKCSKKYFGRS